jgi:DegV family protein with EDD domain
VRGILDGGDDVFFIGFSSGLSSSTPALLEFLPTLAPEYPERKIEMIDSLLPSGGMALFLHYIVERQRSGASLDELVAYAYELRPKVACWFTVDDLMFLHRGGRLSRASALAGTALGIKPVLHVDDEGHLIMMSKAKSRRKSMRALIDKLRTTGIEPISEQTIYINHGDCLDEAKIMGETIREEFGCQDITYLYTAPVIGAHSGPGTLSVFFLAHER